MIIHTLPRRDTQRYQLLELIALSGDFPAELLSRLPGGSTYKESVVKSLKREGLIRTFYRDHLRTYRLTAKAKAQLMAEQPDRFAFYLEGKYSLQGTTQGRYLTGGVPPVRFSM